MEGSQGGDSYGGLASWGKLQTCLTGLLGRVGVLKITSQLSAAGPSAAEHDQDSPSWRNKEKNQSSAFGHRTETFLLTPKRNDAFQSSALKQ